MVKVCEKGRALTRAATLSMQACNIDLSKYLLPSAKLTKCAAAPRLAAAPAPSPPLYAPPHQPLTVLVCPSKSSGSRALPPTLRPTPPAQTKMVVVLTQGGLALQRNHCQQRTLTVSVCVLAWS